MTELKRCPFCGGEASVTEHKFHGLTSTYGIVCLDCCCETRQFFDTADEAIEAWNRRHKEDDMPDADVEPIRHGEWVVDTIYPSGVKKFHCSICGQERTVHEKYEGVFRQNYCPNCGTKMNVEE